ncbi:proline hydroxylase [Sphingomonas koreensis]|nr:proline hydroxylase [Sphingomonas koreensis]
MAHRRSAATEKLWCLDVSGRDDLTSLAARFAETGRVQIPEFLPEILARSLKAELNARTDWTKLVSGSERTFEISCPQYERLASDTMKSLDQALFAEAERGFRYRYDVIRISDAGPGQPASSPFLSAFADFISSEGTMANLSALTGGPTATFADAQATRYRAGDFLTRHDDLKPCDNRVFAYVLNLVENWVAEWGGLLHFINYAGDVTETFRPTFNALTLFSVPQSHSVSFVAPYAGAERISITGWFRTEAPVI